MKTAIDGIIYHTDPAWLEFLVNHHQRGKINFWTYRSKDSIKPPNSNVPFFFKLPGGAIAGMATFVELRRMTLEEMWVEYGIANGESSLEEMQDKYQNHKLSEEGNPFLSCLILEDLFIFDRQVTISSVGLPNFQVRMYLNQTQVDRILDEMGTLDEARKNLAVSGIQPKLRRAFVNSRAFQQELRSLVLEKYDRKCVICGIDNKDLLLVSHIVPVEKNLDVAGETSNTLLLCRLHDGMFDKGLIAVDSSNNIIISRALDSTQSVKLKREIEEIRNITISRDLSTSREYLEWHRTNVFRTR